MGREALRGELGLGCGGEEDVVGAAEQIVLVEPPVEGFFEVLDGAGALEVGVEHAVGEDHVGLVAGDGAEDGEAEVLP